MSTFWNKILPFRATVTKKADTISIDEIPPISLDKLTPDQCDVLSEMLDNQAAPREISQAMQLNPRVVYHYKRYRWSPKDPGFKTPTGVDPEVAAKRKEIEMIKLESEKQKLQAQLDHDKQMNELKLKEQQIKIQERELALQEREEDLKAPIGDEDDGLQKGMAFLEFLKAAKQNIQNQQPQQKTLNNAIPGWEHAIYPGSQLQAQIAPNAVIVQSGQDQEKIPSKIDETTVTDDQIRKAISTLTPEEIRMARLMPLRSLRREVQKRYPELTEKLAERVAKEIKRK